MAYLKLQKDQQVGEVWPMQSLGLCCPQCKGPLAFSQEAYSCHSCTREYPIVLGIPDFRLFPDPYINIEDDYDKGKVLWAHGQNTNFEGLVRFYWSITPIVEKRRAERFMRHVFALVERGQNHLQEIEGCRPTYFDEDASQGVLEIGCGTGGFLVAAGQKYQKVVGMDIAFRWLIVAKKRLDELGLRVPLICGCAEFLPFREKQFELCVAESVIEHVKDQDAAIQELQRVSKPQGRLFLMTSNRYGLAPEPHVGIWGVGVLPRKLMKPYVKFWKGIVYEHIRVLSWMELRRILQRNRFERCQVLLPSFVEKEVKSFSAFEKMQVGIYQGIKTIPILRSLLSLLVPFFNVVAFANGKPAEKLVNNHE